MHIPILFQDEDLLVVNKPAGLLTHQDDSSAPEAKVARLAKLWLQMWSELQNELDLEI
jgi:23S rRNA-/tRNA-specific pseudouridylate synthase